jgi:hypothetical protein
MPSCYGTSSFHSDSPSPTFALPPWQEDMAIALASTDDQVYCKRIKYDARVKKYFDLSAKECSKSTTSSSSNSSLQ